MMDSDDDEEYLNHINNTNNMMLIITVLLIKKSRASIDLRQLRSIHERRVLSGTIRRKSLQKASESVFWKVYNSNQDDSLIQLCGFHKKAFDELVQLFRPHALPSLLLCRVYALLGSAFDNLDLEPSSSSHRSGSCPQNLVDCSLSDALVLLLLLMLVVLLLLPLLQGGYLVLVQWLFLLHHHQVFHHFLRHQALHQPFLQCPGKCALQDAHHRDNSDPQSGSCL